MGLVLALGIVASDRSVVARCLAGAAGPLLACTLFFTFSRGAWVALAAGLLVSFALDPRRLQLVVAAIAVGVPTALALLAALSSDALTERESPLQAAADQGRVVALILLGCGALEPRPSPPSRSASDDSSLPARSGSPSPACWRCSRWARPAPSSSTSTAP